MKNVDVTKSEGTFSFADTIDKVFLLSLDDIQNKDYGFINEESLYCGATEYAVKQGVPSDANDFEGQYYKDNWKYVDGKLACSWWIRSGIYYARIGGESSYIVTYYGYYGCGEMVGEVGSNGGVRPAMWISLQSKSSSSSLNKPKVAVKSKNNAVSVSISKCNGADGYYIYMKKAGDSKYTKVKTLKKDGSKKRTVTISGLTEGKYYFKVKAYKKNGNETVTSKLSSVIAVNVPSRKESFKEKFENLVGIFMWRMAGGISAESTEFMLLDASIYVRNNGTLDYLFDIETGDAVPPRDISENLWGMNEDGTSPYIRCKLSDMLSFIENVLGEKINIDDGYTLYGTYINKDGYLTEWGNGWYVSYEGVYEEISDFTYKYEGDTIIASFKITEYICGDLEGTTLYTTYWKPNSKSPIGYTLKKAEKKDL